MTDRNELAKKIWDIFAQPKPAQRKNYADPDQVGVFTPFNKDHADLAESLYQRFQNIMENSEHELAGYEKVIGDFEQLQGNRNPDLLYYAFKTFLVNYPGTIQFLIPSILVREPELVIPSSSSEKNGIQVEIAIGSPDETKMDWFREDPSLNEHHGHWHIVYSNRRRRDRQGEMFFYMHQQMIARYDADRIARNVARVKAFDDMTSRRIQVGYAPGDDVRLAGLIREGRDPNIWVGLTDRNEQLSNLRAIIADIDQDYYAFNDPSRMEEETRVVNWLGSTLESNPQADNTRGYGNYHGNGHVYIGKLNDGVMYYTEAAIRDVVFWEWHKGVDDIYFRLQERLPAYNFATDAPPVRLRKSRDAAGQPYTPDLILCRKADVSNGNINNEKGQEIANLAFNKWETDFGNGTFTYKDAQGNDQTIRTSNTLKTWIKEGIIRYRDENNQELSYNYPYLEHEAFCYFIRVENTSLQQKKVTLRIFLVPRQNMEDRRSWIEMDKFLYTLPPNAKTVIYRADTESSVIRKPAVTDPSTHNTFFDPVNIPIDDRQCNCGWPYHMLLPSGNDSDQGMPFMLMVMVTDAEIDMMGIEPDCGSLSFCGTNSNRYPDRRPLGYPFNRKFNGNGQAIINTITTQQNMMCRTINIKHQPL